ncbi:hypothetical protein PSV09DRAFT_2282165 [Bipolaris maydis]|uniref:uncharacterized protein n=1 Tax=Cochliobolus heterostrophus TaxID=5016 RepID=UPI0024CE87E1|nr:hypothetical protein PSV09DRAFT_2282165 [Bipolaris maydis]KAJ6275295.1 hypothetical protein PSV08DRAFT_271514 [Bipolaris maydis]
MFFLLFLCLLCMFLCLLHLSSFHAHCAYYVLYFAFFTALGQFFFLGFNEIFAISFASSWLFFSPNL